MGSYLIIANQTLGGEALVDKIRMRIEHGEGRFHVIVPVVVPDDQMVHIEPGLSIAPDPKVYEHALDEARKRAQHRLHAMLVRIRDLGGEADGELVGSDPYEAAKDHLEDHHYNEVIVSTLPLGISKWIRMDLPSRIQRLVEVPVTTVEASTPANA